MLFVFFTLILLQVYSRVFQKLHNDVIPLKANRICASIFLCFKISVLQTSISGKIKKFSTSYLRHQLFSLLTAT